MVPHEQIVRWFEEAYGAESAWIDLLTTQLPDFAEHQEGQVIVGGCLDRSYVHTTLLQQCIGRLGGETSSLQKGGLTAFLSTMRRSIAHDRNAMVRDALLALSAQHFKIATYTALVAAAEQQSDEQSASICRRILQEEQALASRLAGLLETVVGAALAG